MYLDKEGMAMNKAKIAEKINNFTFTPNKETSIGQHYSRLNLRKPIFDANILAELGAFLPGLF